MATMELYPGTKVEIGGEQAMNCSGSSDFQTFYSLWEELPASQVLEFLSFDLCDFLSLRSLRKDSLNF